MGAGAPSPQDGRGAWGLLVPVRRVRQSPALAAARRAASALRCHVWRVQEGKQDANGQEATPLRAMPVADNPGGAG
jgi:hypothetical protein